MKEIWRQCVDQRYEPIQYYEVSNFGRVRSMDRYCGAKNGSVALRKGKILPSYDSGRGWLQAQISINGKVKRYSVHVLVALAFPELCGYFEPGLEVDHRDGNPSNNVASNLHFVTRSENRLNPVTYERNLKNWVEQIHKLTPEQRAKGQMKTCRQIICDGLCQVFCGTRAVADELGVSVNVVRQYLQGVRKKPIKGFTLRYAK